MEEKHETHFIDLVHLNFVNEKNPLKTQLNTPVYMAEESESKSARL